MKNLKKMILSSILIALAIALSYFKIPLGGTQLRFSTTILVLSSLIVGPLWGAAVGFLTDILKILVGESTTGINLYTLTSMLYGFLPGLMYVLFKKYHFYLIFFICYFTLILGSFINSYQEFLWSNTNYQAILISKTPSYLIVLPIHSLIVALLYKNIEVIQNKFKF